MPLSDTQLAALRARLRDRAEQLRHELSETLHAPGAREALGLPNRREETDDDAVADLETSIDVASVERDAQELGQVLEAVGRLDRGSYGACAECGKPIAWARLAAQPHASRCISCETAHESRHPRASPRGL